jgi:prephenate dehydratase
VRIAYQGEPGAFSHQACLQFAPDAEPVAFPSFEAVIEAVRGRRCGQAMLPVENSIAGPVEAVLALLEGAGLRERGRFELPVRMMLIGAPGARLEDLRSVASHPVALRQCRALIAELGLLEAAAFDTAGAARLLAEAPDRSRGVLASRTAADLHRLPVLRADVQDQADNRTTFVLLEP